MVDYTNKLIFKLRKVDMAKKEEALADQLLDDETVIGAYQSMRDYVVFTDKRIICVNVQGITGKKKDFTSMPYSKINTFSIETAGVLDLDSELEIYIAGVEQAVHFDFTGFSDIKAIGKAIAKYVLR